MTAPTTAKRPPPSLTALSPEFDKAVALAVDEAVEEPVLVAELEVLVEDFVVLEPEEEEVVEEPVVEELDELVVEEVADEETVLVESMANC